MSRQDAPGAPARRKRGFERPGALIGTQLRRAGETRGFAEARLLTHWAEIVGEEIARRARPVKVGYAQGGLGATLTLFVLGADAPLVQAETAKIRERVNACYGYNAISRIRLTQTAPDAAAPGLAETQAPFAPPAPPPAVQAEARALSGDVTDDGLRRALETLCRNVLSRNHR